MRNYIIKRELSKYRNKHEIQELYLGYLLYVLVFTSLQYENIEDFAKCL